MVSILPADGSLRTLLLRCLAVVSTLCAVIHFAVAGAHFQEYWAFGVFMLGAAWLQLTWAIAVTVRPSRVLLAAGAVLNAGVIIVYVVTRTLGDVVGPTPNDVEPVGFGDLFCTICEGILVAISVMLLFRSMSRSVARPQLAALMALVSTCAVVLLSLALVDGGPEMVMDMSQDSLPAISLPTKSPAGPVRMPNPDMQMEPGMKMAGGSCQDTPSATQQSAAVDLVNTSWADAQKFRSLATAKAAGFRPLTPTGKAVVHYINPANYQATRRGGPVLAPSAPQSLVYANTPKGAVLVAVMYIAPRRSGATPDPGGCLTQWHVHTNLCFGHGAVVGITDPTCPPDSVNRVSPPMLHVWFVPVPGGPTAVDATDAQIVQAAEQVQGPHNGSA